MDDDIMRGESAPLDWRYPNSRFSVPIDPSLEPFSQNAMQEGQMTGLLEDAGSEGDEDDAFSQVSDADSDMADLQRDILRQDKEQYVFASKQRQEATGQKMLGAKPRTRTKRGPRKLPRPTADIVYRLSKAKEAFDGHDWSLAIEILEDTILLHPDTGLFQAYMLLSSVHEERNDRTRAIMARISAAQIDHRNVVNWLSTAKFVLDSVVDLEDGPEKTRAFQAASSCYSQVLTVDREHVEARTAKADILLLLGQASAAVGTYRQLLKYRPLNIMSVRNMADVALDSSDPVKNGELARQAYKTIIDHCFKYDTAQVEDGVFEWSDLRIYVEFYDALQRWDEGARELAEVARWLLGRRAESFWDQWVDDDREWDLEDDRRLEVAGFVPGQYAWQSYGMGLPIDLRAKLFVFRLRQGRHTAALAHEHLVDAARATALEDYRDFPDCLKDMGCALLAAERPERALPYFDLYRRIADEDEDGLAYADVLVNQGRCCLQLGDKARAEDLFIQALETDEGEIEARVELATMYHDNVSQKEGQEEAYLLLAEALDLKEQQREREMDRGGDAEPRRPKRRPRQKGDMAKLRAKNFQRLLNKERREQEEARKTEEVCAKHEAMRALKERMTGGDQEALAQWMQLAKELTDQFRSVKQFYPWEKYVKFLGHGQKSWTRVSMEQKWKALGEMTKRLGQHLAPTAAEDEQRIAVNAPSSYRGLSMDTWLDMFLEYAVRTAQADCIQEAYLLCNAARDAIVYKSRENTYYIHLAWAACAILGNDEETCVAVARFFMKEYAPGTDSCRMFTALCRICQSPVSWYTSGPAQKFFLRQIRHMDNVAMTILRGREGLGADDELDGTALPPLNGLVKLDVCLVIIYGQILFTTASYRYALLYFARAVSMAPDNAMVHLCSGLAYVHHALQRQSKNRQYLLMQGFAFLQRYYELRLQGPPAREGGATFGERQEAHFNMGRAYSLLGLNHLAVAYYAKVLEVARGGLAESVVPMVDDVLGRQDLVVEAAFNVRTICYQVGDLEGAMAVTEAFLVL